MQTSNTPPAHGRALAAVSTLMIYSMMLLPDSNAAAHRLIKLAGYFRQQGKCGLAEVFYKHAFVIWKRLIVEDHRAAPANAAAPRPARKAYWLESRIRWAR